MSFNLPSFPLTYPTFNLFTRTQEIHVDVLLPAKQKQTDKQIAMSNTSS